MFKIGDKILYGDCDSKKTIADMMEGTITRVNKEFAWVDNQHKSEDCIYLAYCWPIAAKDRLADIMQRRYDAQKDLSKSFGEIYQLMNAVKRGEI